MLGAPPPDPHAPGRRPTPRRAIPRDSARFAEQQDGGGGGASAVSVVPDDGASVATAPSVYTGDAGRGTLDARLRDVSLAVQRAEEAASRWQRGDNPPDALDAAAGSRAVEAEKARALMELDRVREEVERMHELAAARKARRCVPSGTLPSCLSSRTGPL
jgi:hypothetical protein